MITEYTEQFVDFGADNIGNPPPGVIYVFRENGVPAMVDFLCPCGCGTTCPTHLVPPGTVKQPNDRHWEYSPGPTLRPSIRYVGGCKAHFTITDGKVQIHGNSGK